MSDLVDAILSAAAWADKRGIPLPADMRREIDALKTYDYYDRVLSQAVRDFYRGDIDRGQLEDEMLRLIDEQLTRAWNEGSRDVGVEPSDMTAEDLSYLESAKNSELDHIGGFIDDIEQSIQDGEGFQQFYPRVEMWANRYTEMVNTARIYFGGKTRLKWNLGATEQHCATCSQLNGIVAWADEWNESAIRPQNPPNDLLECGGWKCDCSLEPTDERRSPNALNRLMDIATSRNV